MTRTKKQTAGNNAFLADVKHLFNVRLFRMATEMFNSGRPEELAKAEFRAYLRAHITRNEDHIQGLGTGKRYY